MDTRDNTTTEDHWIKRHVWLVITGECIALFIATDLLLVRRVACSRWRTT